jgi:hypothetical protein
MGIYNDGQRFPRGFCFAAFSAELAELILARLRCKRLRDAADEMAVCPV